MAGADGSQLRDVTRWAASFMARLFTGATPAHLLAEEDVLSGGGSCNSLYRSISMEEDDVELDGDTRRPGSEFAVEADESNQEQLLAADEGEDPCRARSVCEFSLSHGVHTAMSKAHELRQRHSTGAAPRSGDAAIGAAESEPLVLRPRAAKQANDVVETVDHPFGRGRRERESSLLLLLSS